jgi:protein gp37
LEETLSATTGIEWTGRTWNPVAGCGIVSPGCTNCYAMKSAHKLSKHPDPAVNEKYSGLTKLVNGKPVWTDEVRLWEPSLHEPGKWRKPALVFTNSMSDLFHKDMPKQAIARVWASMAIYNRHTYQVLTKRPEIMVDWLYDPASPAAVQAEMGVVPLTEWPLPNVWVGTSVEDQRRADERIRMIRRAPAAVRFLSMEPLLGPTSISQALQGMSLEKSLLDWVIVGGESGTGSRPMHPDWVRTIRDECVESDIPFFFKQVGQFAWINRPASGRKASALMPDGKIVDPGTPGAQELLNCGKESAGKEIDGQIWQQMPKVFGNRVFRAAA